VGHAGSIITHPFLLAVLVALFGHTACLFLAAVALGCRLMGCISVEKAFGLPCQQYWLIPIQDMIASSPTSATATDCCRTAVSLKSKNKNVGRYCGSRKVPISQRLTSPRLRGEVAPTLPGQTAGASLLPQDHAAFTSIRRIARCASAGFGTRIVSTPLS
jgi:hypothetical protein